MYNKELEECVKHNIPVLTPCQFSADVPIQKYINMRSRYDGEFLTFHHKPLKGTKSRFYTCDDDVRSTSPYSVHRRYGGIVACFDVVGMMCFMSNNTILASSYETLKTNSEGTHITVHVFDGNDNVWDSKLLEAIAIYVSDIDTSTFNRIKLKYSSKRLVVRYLSVNSETLPEELINLGIELDITISYPEE